MIAVFIMWVFTFIVVYLLGYSLIHNFQLIKREVCEPTVSETFFIGLIFLSFYCSIYSIFAPINGLPLIIILVITLGRLINKKSIFHTDLKRLVRKGKKMDRSYSLVGLLIAFYLVLVASSGIHISDTSLYHAQSIQWLQEYAVIPGLGNLHGRLAFNFMSFPLETLFAVDISFGSIKNSLLIYPLNGTLVVVLMFKLINSCKEANRKNNGQNIVFNFTLIFLILLIFSSKISSPSPDTTCAVLIIYSLLLFNEIKHTEISWFHFILLTGLILLCVSFKLSSVCFLLLLIPVLVKEYSHKRLVVLTSFGLITFIPFFVRNYYLSGYLVYPFPSIDIFDVDWKIPIDKVISEKAWIKSWARIPSSPPNEVLNLKLNKWFTSWFFNKNVIYKFLILINVFSIVPLVFHTIKKNISITITILVIQINILFWFFNAPDPRFIFGFLFFGAAITLSDFYTLLEKKELVRSDRSKIVRYATLSLLVCGIIFPNKSRIHFVLMNPFKWIIPESLPEPKLKEIKTNFTYFTPLIEYNNNCFNAQIPCTPYPKSNLILRGELIRNGFKIEKEKEK